jgi:uncharacterized membrane protein
MLKYILALALLLRLIALNQSLWLDEATTANTVQNLDMVGIITQLAPNDFHPPLYYLFMEVWGSLLGTSEVVLRLPSVLFALGTITILYKLIKKQFNETTALVVGLLLATAPLFIYYSQEARMYSMAAFFVAASVSVCIQYLGKKNRLYMASAGSLFAIAFLTDYVTIFMGPVFLTIWYLGKKRRLEDLIYFIAPFIVALVGIFPIFTYQFSGALHVKESGSLWWGILGAFTPKNVALIPIKFLIGRIGFDSNVVYGLYAGGALALSGFLIVKAWLGRQKNKVIPYVAWLFVSVTAAIAFSTLLPILTYFRLLFALPALYVLIAIGIVKLKEHFFMPALLGMMALNIISSALYLSNSRFQREDWRGLVQAVSQETESTQVVFSGNSQMEAFDYYSAGIDRVGPENISFDTENIWLMRYVHDIYDPQNLLPGRIEAEGYTKVREHDFNGIVVWEYEYENSD